MENAKSVPDDASRNTGQISGRDGRATSISNRNKKELMSSVLGAARDVTRKVGRAVRGGRKQTIQTIQMVTSNNTKNENPKQPSSDDNLERSTTKESRRPSQNRIMYEPRKETRADAFANQGNFNPEPNYHENNSGPFFETRSNIQSLENLQPGSSISQRRSLETPLPPPPTSWPPSQPTSTTASAQQLKRTQPLSKTPSQQQPRKESPPLPAPGPPTQKRTHEQQASLPKQQPPPSPTPPPLSTTSSQEIDIPLYPRVTYEPKYQTGYNLSSIPPPQINLQIHCPKPLETQSQPFEEPTSSKGRRLQSDCPQVSPDTCQFCNEFISQHMKNINEEGAYRKHGGQRQFSKDEITTNCPRCANREANACPIFFNPRDLSNENSTVACPRYVKRRANKCVSSRYESARAESSGDSKRLTECYLETAVYRNLLQMIVGIKPLNKCMNRIRKHHCLHSKEQRTCLSRMYHEAPESPNWYYYQEHQQPYAINSPLIFVNTSQKDQNPCSSKQFGPGENRVNKVWPEIKSRSTKMRRFDSNCKYRGCKDIGTQSPVWATPHVCCIQESLEKIETSDDEKGNIKKLRRKQFKTIQFSIANTKRKNKPVCLNVDLSQFLKNADSNIISESQVTSKPDGEGGNSNRVLSSCNDCHSRRLKDVECFTDCELEDNETTTKHTFNREANPCDITNDQESYKHSEKKSCHCNTKHEMSCDKNYNDCYRGNKCDFIEQQKIKRNARLKDIENATMQDKQDFGVLNDVNDDLKTAWKKCEQVDGNFLKFIEVKQDIPSATSGGIRANCNVSPSIKQYKGIEIETDNYFCKCAKEGKKLKIISPSIVHDSRIFRETNDGCCTCTTGRQGQKLKEIKPVLFFVDPNATQKQQNKYIKGFDSMEHTLMNVEELNRVSSSHRNYENKCQNQIQSSISTRSIYPDIISPAYHESNTNCDRKRINAMNSANNVSKRETRKEFKKYQQSQSKDTANWISHGRKYRERNDIKLSPSARSDECCRINVQRRKQEGYIINRARTLFQMNMKSGITSGKIKLSNYPHMVEYIKDYDLPNQNKIENDRKKIFQEENKCQRSNPSGINEFDCVTSKGTPVPMHSDVGGQRYLWNLDRQRTFIKTKQSTAFDVPRSKPTVYETCPGISSNVETSCLDRDKRKRFKARDMNESRIVSLASEESDQDCQDSKNGSSQDAETSLVNTLELSPSCTECNNTTKSGENSGKGSSGKSDTSVKEQNESNVYSVINDNEKVVNESKINLNSSECLSSLDIDTQASCEFENDKKILNSDNGNGLVNERAEDDNFLASKVSNDNSNEPLCDVYGYVSIEREKDWTEDDVNKPTFYDDDFENVSYSHSSCSNQVTSPIIDNETYGNPSDIEICDHNVLSKEGEISFQEKKLSNNVGSDTRKIVINRICKDKESDGYSDSKEATDTPDLLFKRVTSPPETKYYSRGSSKNAVLDNEEPVYKTYARNVKKELELRDTDIHSNVVSSQIYKDTNGNVKSHSHGSQYNTMNRFEEICKIKSTKSQEERNEKSVENELGSESQSNIRERNEASNSQNPNVDLTLSNMTLLSDLDEMDDVDTASNLHEKKNNETCPSINYNMIRDLVTLRLCSHEKWLAWKNSISEDKNCYQTHECPYYSPDDIPTRCISNSSDNSTISSPLDSKDLSETRKRELIDGLTRNNKNKPVQNQFLNDKTPSSRDKIPQHKSPSSKYNSDESQSMTECKSKTSTNHQLPSSVRSATKRSKTSRDSCSQNKENLPCTDKCVKDPCSEGKKPSSRQYKSQCKYPCQECSRNRHDDTLPKMIFKSKTSTSYSVSSQSLSDESSNSKKEYEKNASHIKQNETRENVSQFKYPCRECPRYSSNVPASNTRMPKTSHQSQKPSSPADSSRPCDDLPDSSLNSKCKVKESFPITDQSLKSHRHQKTCTHSENQPCFSCSPDKHKLCKENPESPEFEISSSTYNIMKINENVDSHAINEGDGTLSSITISSGTDTDEIFNDDTVPNVLKGEVHGSTNTYACEESILNSDEMNAPSERLDEKTCKEKMTEHHKHPLTCTPSQSIKDQCDDEKKSSSIYKNTHHKYPSQNRPGHYPQRSHSKISLKSQNSTKDPMSGTQLSPKTCDKCSPSRNSCSNKKCVFCEHYSCKKQSQQNSYLRPKCKKSYQTPRQSNEIITVDKKLDSCNDCCPFCKINEKYKCNERRKQQSDCKEKQRDCNVQEKIPSIRNQKECKSPKPKNPNTCKSDPRPPRCGGKSITTQCVKESSVDGDEYLKKKVGETCPCDGIINDAPSSNDCGCRGRKLQNDFAKNKKINDCPRFVNTKFYCGDPYMFRTDQFKAMECEKCMRKRCLHCGRCRYKCIPLCKCPYRSKRTGVGGRFLAQRGKYLYSKTPSSCCITKPVCKVPLFCQINESRRVMPQHIRNLRIPSTASSFDCYCDSSDISKRNSCHEILYENVKCHKSKSNPKLRNHSKELFKSIQRRCQVLRNMLAFTALQVKSKAVRKRAKSLMKHSVFQKSGKTSENGKPDLRQHLKKLTIN